MKNERITQQQVDYIKAHINDRPRTKVARDAGVSMCTLYRVVREAGGEMCYDRARRNPEHVEIVRRCYPVMTTREIADRYGINYGRINKIARELGVRHGPEVQARLDRERNARLAAVRANTDQAASTAKWRRKRRYDELRVMSGLRPLTKFRMKAIQQKAYKAKWGLCRRQGYMEAEGNPYLLLYDGTTRRSKNESYYTKKYGLKFKYYGAETEKDDNNLLEGQRHCP